VTQKKRFVEDPNRIMRAFRQSGELDLAIEEDTFRAIKNDYHLMETLIPKSYVRLFNELFKMMKVNNNRMIKNLEYMDNLGILKFLGLKKKNTNLNTNSSIIVKIAMLMCVDELEEDIKKWGHDR
jgi:tRNA nucleotidyltransferase/poly(A) polymerase